MYTNYCNCVLKRNNVLKPFVISKTHIFAGDWVDYLC